ncbi:MAG: hypothetical protein MUE46_03205 [Xanthomonadales bacterium]|jgi:hypothetical protein|nr:hypothetical protein [Xanthomonadales bacterium]
MNYPPYSITVAVSPKGSSNPNPVTVTAPTTIRYQMNQTGYAVAATDLPDQLTQIGSGETNGYHYADVYDAFTSSGPRSAPVVLNFNLKITHVETGHSLRHDPEVCNEDEN